MARSKNISGWVLLTRERETPAFGPDKDGPWFICWHEIFDTKKAAIEFAVKNGWMPPYKAVRGQLSAVA